jgi:serine/threonine protein kinase
MSALSPDRSDDARPAGAIEGARFVVGDAASSAYPQRFGPYVLLSRIARGGMGDVCLAKLVGVAGIERLCVVKSIRSNLLGDDEYVRRFIDEARTVVQLVHRNICPVLDVGAVGAQYYLAMELVSGRDVRRIQERAHQQNQKISERLVLHIIGELLEALDYAHRVVDARTGEPLGLVHRDVSPQNLLVSFEGEVKLIDFGLALSKHKLERTEPGVVLGKLQYMSPEHARGDRIDRRTDVFAAGVLLYELLVGERYYEGLSLEQVWDRVGMGTHAPRRMSALAAELRAIVQRALAADPAARFQSAGELRAALHDYAVRRQQIGSASELRAWMTALFPGEEADERRTRATLGATPLPALDQNDVTSSVRFAAPGQIVDDSTAVVVGVPPISEVSRPASAAPTVEVSRPSRGAPTVELAPVSVSGSHRGRSRLPIVVSFAFAIAAVAALVVVAMRADVVDEARTPRTPIATPAAPVVAAEPPVVAPEPPVVAPVAPVAPVAAIIEPIEPIVAAGPARALEVKEPESVQALAAREPTRREARHSEKRPRRETVAAPAPSSAASTPTSTPTSTPAPLPDAPATTTGRVKYLADHCRAVQCAAPLLAAQERWKSMSDAEARDHVAAVKQCIARCRAP